MDQPIVSDGGYTYRVNAQWAKVPEGFVIRDVPAVAVDARDNVYIFSRNEHPVMVFDKDGNFLRSWGEGQFSRPHGARVGPDDSIYLVDDHLHVVRKYDLTGKLQFTLGKDNTPSKPLSGLPFNKCTGVAIGRDGYIYVADGYQNAAIHKFAPDGRFVKSWGKPGYRPGEFNLPHDLVCDNDGFIYVVDRENYRVQVFNEDGIFQAEWTDMFRPLAIAMKETSAGKRFFVGGAAPGLGPIANWWGLGPYISIMDEKGHCIARLGDGQPSAEVGRFLSPHGIALDSQQNLYVGEAADSAWPKYFKEPMPANIKTFQKLELIKADA